MSLSLPVTLEDYKCANYLSPGRHDLPTSLEVMPCTAEKSFISALVSELNVGLIAGLDPEPNHSRSSKRPEMYVGLREGSVESALVVGASHAGRLAAAMSTLGVDTHKIARGGWKLTKENVDHLIRDLVEVLSGAPAGTPVICFCLDNSSFLCVTEDGGMVPFSRCVDGDDGFHGVGDMVIAPERALNSAVDQ